MTVDPFDSFFRENYQHVLRFLKRRIDDESAADICSEVFAVAWKVFDESDPPRLPWLYQTARNRLGNAYRKRQRESALTEKLRRESFKRDGDSSTLIDISIALSSLPPKDREALELTYWEGLAAAEVALVLGCSEQAAWKRLSRAKLKLRSILHQFEKEVGAHD